MRWYLMHEGKTAGPVSGEDIFEQGRQGQLFPSMHVRDEAGAWMPIGQSPFASVVSMPAAPAPQTPAGGLGASIGRIALGVVAGVILLVGGLVLVGFLTKTSPAPAASAPAPPEARPLAPQQPTLAERLVKATTLREAVALTRPLMGDVTGEEVTAGAAALAVWWTRKPTLWAELAAMPDTRRAEIMKDAEPYRGRRICMTGSVTQIYRDKSAGVNTPVYGGVLYHNGGFVRFLAVQSTQGVVENTPARFCGITIGLQSYPNNGGGTTHAIQVVGLFDIAENGGKGLPQYDEW